MIFLTVGTQLAFPRLTGAMNQFAETTSEPVLAQVGDETNDLHHLEVRRMMDPVAFDQIFAQARIVVSHAGIGTILSAKRFHRPLIIVPRRHDLGEHRNDHQLATARALEGTPGIHIAWQVEDLPALLQRKDLTTAQSGMGPKHGALIDGISNFIHRVDAPLSEHEKASSLKDAS